jgi:hypothetical protein
VLGFLDVDADIIRVRREDVIKIIMSVIVLDVILGVIFRKIKMHFGKSFSPVITQLIGYILSICFNQRWGLLPRRWGRGGRGSLPRDSLPREKMSILPRKTLPRGSLPRETLGSMVGCTLPRGIRILPRIPSVIKSGIPTTDNNTRENHSSVKRRPKASHSEEHIWFMLFLFVVGGEGVVVVLAMELVVFIGFGFIK